MLINVKTLFLPLTKYSHIRYSKSVVYCPHVDYNNCVLCYYPNMLIIIIIIIRVVYESKRKASV